FARTIGAVMSTTITLGESGWFKIATVVMPQSTSTVVIKLYGGAGFNAGSPEQAAISELVLRAGNGSPVGITATLWRRSPSSANEVAWVNTSGDTYDIYINIGQYAYWLIAQYDYTGNANVTLYSAPEYSETKPANATNGQTYTLYNSMMKPTAGDVEALSVNGGRLNGNLGIGTPNILGGSSIVLGDNDTGLKQNGDGLLDIYANGVQVFRFQNDTLESKKSINVTGRLTPTDYGNFDSRYVQDIRLGSLQYAQVWNGPGFSDTSGYVITGVTNGNSDELIDGVHRRPIQKLIGNQWYNVVSI
ncbi:hypothetical protein CER61_004661, partial [Salmonella enterica]|nr:hypothetical protein [Salmonella enterica]